MAHKLFALLVGINDYPPQVGKLDGCLNDIDHMRAYLSANFDPAGLAIEVLENADATRANVIGQFRGHLGKAGAGDVVLFHYCGHGARWYSAAPFREFYPDGWDEGLVCIDSRLDGGYDLADKELAVLLAETGKSGAHVAVILDSCHSGSGTRDIDEFGGMKVRATSDVPAERPLASYLDGYYSSLLQTGGSLAIPASKHILLAACERTQKAKELQDQSGVFTSTLVEVLQATRGDLSYSDLFVRCRAAVVKRAHHQLPQFEAIGNFNAAAGFLGRTATNPGRRYGVYFDAGLWKLECGAIDGIPAAPDKIVTLAVYPEADPSHPAGSAHTVRVAPQRSEIRLDFPGDHTQRYQAEITSLPVAPLMVYCAAGMAGRELLRQTLEADRSVNIMLTEIEAGARYALAMEAGNLLLKNRERDQVIRGVSLTSGTLPEAAGPLLVVLRSVAQWERARGLRNPATKLDTSQVDFEFAERLDGGAEHVHPPGEIVVDYCKNAEGWQPIRGKMRVRNRSPQVLHFALFYFSASFGIFRLSNDPVQPNGAAVTLWGEQPGAYFHIKDGAIEAIDDFKIIVSTEKVDDFLLQQESVPLGVIVDVRALVASREVGMFEPPIDKLTLHNEWFTKDIRIRTVRRLAQVGPRDAALPGGKILIKGHSSVQANLSLCAATSGGRGPTDDQAFFKAFERMGLALVNFAGTRGEDASVLELTDIENAAALEHDPLEIQVNLPLADNEAILPVIYDGRFVLLGGDVYKDPDGSTRISIDHIPDIADKRRSLGGSLRLFFLKTLLKQSDVNRLRWIEYRADGSCGYRNDLVAEKVKAARNVLLLVHGIIGDTENMALGVKSCGLDGQFDLVLAYDYENLGTPIEKTAQALEAQLAAAGLTANDGKRLTLLVHSMGGLVSRWFIERGGGGTIVDHLVMCGTPNAGSPFGEIDGARKIMSALAGLSMNLVPAMIPFSSAVLMVLNRSKALTPTLEQMNPSSDFIRTLNASPDPGIPYTILAGDIDAYKSNAEPFFGELLVKVGQSAIFGALFAEKPNDIAVGVASILGVASQRTPAPAHGSVACHHLNYFTSSTGQEALKAVKWL